MKQLTICLQVRLLAITLTLLGLLLLLSPSCFSQQKDVFGWQGARWGMTNEDVLKTFGERLKKLPKSEVFLRWHVDYVIPEFQLEGEDFTVYFQMSDATNRLSQVLIRLNEHTSRVPRKKIFNSLESLLERQNGKPSNRNDEKRTSSDGFLFIELARTWNFPTTTVELTYRWDNQIDDSLLTIRYFSTKAMPRTTQN